ncbi:restriction endonuclease subunit S [Streptomyces griseoluteus]|uniref:restriction endonuclease subunit S n=1 Tax=Streptomyces griseoluteus TaxID=29306 RepID=UPI0037FCAA8D
MGNKETPTIPTRPLSTFVTSVSSGKTTRRDTSGQYPLYGSTGQIGVTNRVEFSGPSILVARVGVNAGSVYRVDGHYGVTDNTLVIRPAADQCVEFLAEVLQHANLNRMVYGSGQPLVTGTMLKHLEIPDLPPVDQQKISNVLGEASNLIAALERTIAKKQAVKQGMMQQLLTGATRFRGCSGTMHNRRLLDVSLKIQDGTHFSPKLGGSDFKYVTSKNIGPGWLKLDNVETISKTEHEKIYARCDTKFGDLLLTKDGANTGNAALNTFHEEISLLSSVAFIRCDPLKASEGYIMQYLLSRPGRQQITDAMAGNALTRLTLQKIRNLVVPMPPVEEQRVIAQTLGQVDKEISVLHERVRKAVAMKRGMMQQLLTGRTRLPSGEVAT